MQALIYYFAAKQVHENPGAAEEDHCPQNQPFVEIRKDDACPAPIVADVVLRSRVEDQERRHEHDGRERQQVNQKRAAAQKILSYFQPQDAADLTPPEPPRASDSCLFDLLNFSG